LVHKALIDGPSPHLVIGHIVKDTFSIVSSFKTHSFSYTRT